MSSNIKEHQAFYSRDNYLIFALIFLVLSLMLFSVVSMYSISIGEFDYKTKKQMFFTLFFVLSSIFFVKIHTIYIFKYSYYIYFFCLAVLIVTEFVGHKAMGAKRWINFGFINIQPSEFMKIGIILILSYYLHIQHINDIKKPSSLLVPIIFILIPVALIIRQPNLGTATIIILTSAAILFLSGVRIKFFIIAGIIVSLCIPIIWSSLHTYQKNRIINFLNPEGDALGAGYNTIQSIISVGSGGFFGKGFLQGTQNQLKFLPENHTDFIFASIAEEGGFITVAILMIIYLLILLILYIMSLQCTAQFSRLIILGFASLLFFHLMINIGMITGLLPVVGVPLPFISYGGSNFIAMSIGVNMAINSYINKEVKIPKNFL
ncbi:MAG: rod shape determining protein RodA [Candidatus Midichloriaceae bacterium]|jgi:rod shape determining protein RodA